MLAYSTIKIGDYGDWPYYELGPRILTRHDFTRQQHRKSVYLTQEQFDEILKLYFLNEEKLKSRVNCIFEENEKEQENEETRSRLEQEIKECLKIFPVVGFSNL